MLLHRSVGFVRRLVAVKYFMDKPLHYSLATVALQLATRLKDINVVLWNASTASLFNVDVPFRLALASLCSGKDNNFRFVQRKICLISANAAKALRGHAEIWVRQPWSKRAFDSCRPCPLDIVQDLLLASIGICRAFEAACAKAPACLTLSGCASEALRSPPQVPQQARSDHVS